MKIFEVNKNIKVICEWKKTRTAFKHEATAFYKDRELGTVKICYLNRTWERYEFESVLCKALDEFGLLWPEARKQALDRFANENHAELKKSFGAIAAVAKMGDIFGQTPKEKNDWKKRMLVAGLGNKGLSFPDDWDLLSEDEKARRIDGAIKQIS